jgi:hypothetical protein
LFRKISQTALLAIGIALASQPSGAVTLTFGGTDVDPYIEGGFQIDIARITTGNCDFGGNNASSPCMGLNNNETSTLTKVGGGTFTLNSFWFEFLGNHGTLTVTPSTGGPLVLTEAVLGSNDGGQVIPVAFGLVTSVVFAVDTTGNVRIDGIDAVGPPGGPPVATPLPGAVWLFGTVLAGGAGFGRWRKRKAKRAALVPAAT